MGYAVSAVLALPWVADSQVLKPLRKADRGRTCVRAQHPEPPDARRRTQRVAITIPGRKWTSLAEAVPRAEFALVNDHLVLFAVGRERTRAYSILIVTSALSGPKLASLSSTGGESRREEALLAATAQFTNRPPRSAGRRRLRRPRRAQPADAGHPDEQQLLEKAAEHLTLLLPQHSIPENPQSLRSPSAALPSTPTRSWRHPASAAGNLNGLPSPQHLQKCRSRRPWRGPVP